MFAAIVREITHFVETHDWLTFIEECGSREQCEAEAAKLLSYDPGVMVAYLETFDGAAQNIIDRITVYLEGRTA